MLFKKLKIKFIMKFINIIIKIDKNLKDILLFFKNNIF